MIDFASALYLGMRHPAGALGTWDALTTGLPAALAAAPLARRVAADAASLQGTEAGMVGASTLHLAIDAFDRLGRTHALIADDALYPVMRWALERMMGRGVPVTWFRHGDAADLAHKLGRRAAARPPAVVTDATVGDGVPAPIERYVNAVRREAGLVLVDHSQVLGLTGERALSRSPWGQGGGGALRHAALTAPSTQPVLLLASWAKAFGAPLATLCGPAALINDIARDGPAQSHCSPASAVALLAALAALAINRRAGARLRLRLLHRLHRLHDGLRALARFAVPDLHVSGRWHPLQRLELASDERALALHAGLIARGMRTALLRQRGGGYALIVIARADHRVADIDALLDAIASLAPRLPAARGVARRITASTEIEHV
jgi:8-amino-7-oxononanoate synthase